MQLGVTRRNIARLVLVIWALSLAWLARREFSRGESGLAADDIPRIAPAAHFFRVMAAGQQIGQFNLTVDTLVDGVVVRELLLLDYPGGRATRQLSRGTEITLSRSLRLRNFSYSVVGLGQQERLNGELREDSTLSLVQTELTRGAATRARLRIHPDQVLVSAMPFRLAHLGRLHPGAELSLPKLDLEGGNPAATVAIRVTAESTFVVPDSAVWDSGGRAWVPATMDTVRAWRIEHDGPGAPTISWVDAGGVLVHQETPGGITLERSAFEIVRDNDRVRRATVSQAWRRRVPGMLVLTETRRGPDTAAQTRRFMIEIDSVRPWPGTSLLDAGRQAWSGNLVTIDRDGPPDSTATAPAYALQSTWELPIRDGGIETAAMEALQGARTGTDSLRQLTLWVARNIATDSGSSVATTALYTLRSRQGTAEGQSRLLAAMARSRGIPARVVSGLALTQEESYAHTWVELWQGRWIAADPTFGHFPASASLLRLVEGGGTRGIGLLAVAASARFLPVRSLR